MSEEAFEVTRQPAFFIPHGGGPCFFMDDPREIWAGMAAFLKSLPERLPAPPTAILVVSGHWETDGFSFTGNPAPPLIYDYNGFPPHTYDLRFDAPGAPTVAAEAATLLRNAGLKAAVDGRRGLDHGVFIPLKVAFPNADVPVVEMSVDRSLDPSLHLAAGKALAQLRERGVLILGSGMSFHNMRGYGDRSYTEPSRAFDRWLTDAVAKPAALRSALLSDWESAPAARMSHPREEHLIPLMVASGASENAGHLVYNEETLLTAISGYRFD